MANWIPYHEAYLNGGKITAGMVIQYTVRGGHCHCCGQKIGDRHPISRVNEIMIDMNCNPVLGMGRPMIVRLADGASLHGDDENGVSEYAQIR